MSSSASAVIKARPGSPMSATRPRIRRECCPVEIEQGLHELAGLVAGGWIGKPLEVFNQGLEVLDPAPGFGIGWGRVCHDKSPA